MKKLKHMVAWLPLVALCFSCSEAVDDMTEKRAVKFSISREWNGSRAASPAVFGKGDAIGVFACYTPAGEEEPSFDSNFMRNQLVSFDGSVWSYSPVKYWPTDGTVRFRGYFPYSEKHGLLTIDHECKTGLEPLYAASSSVKVEKGKLSGDGIGENGALLLGFSPLLNRVNFNANAADSLFDEVETEEYKDCRFLIREFRVWGFYSRARYSMTDGSWSGRATAYTREEPLEMTHSLALKNVEDSVPGYVYNPDEGYCTDKAVVVKEASDAINIFDRSAYFIPMDGVIPGNDPGFEIVYVVLTNKEGENVYKESGIVTRTGSLREIFAGNNGLIKKIINVNMTFSVDGVTVTRDLTDYIYKPMF
ncbi:MAG: fimbrillin family protein [Bacteroides sp.]|nr:fimbrillin family protein [Bacteroides sp.]MCM1389251.1 fimbrillin family protein [Bacteroides sp.]